MYSIQLDIYDAAGNRQGPGPITTVRNVTITRRLDGAGSVSVTVPGTDARVVALVENEARGYLRIDRGDGLVDLERFIMRQINLQIDNDDVAMVIDGPTELDELKRKSVLLNRQYGASSAATVGAVVSDLVGQVSGWTADVESASAGNQISARFDGVSILKALQECAKLTGLHMRQAIGSRTVEFGAFGEAIDLTLIAPPQGDWIVERDDVAVLRSISVTDDSEAIVNWLIPLGGGEGEAALTLADSTRVAVAPLERFTTTGPDGSTLYGIRHAGSIATYGQNEKVATFKDVSPIANSEAAKEVAANALYDTAAAYLERAAVKQSTYEVVASGVRRVVRPGDKIRMKYLGVVDTDDGRVTYRQINGEYWVTAVRESIGLDDDTVTLTISNIDRVQMDAADVVVGAIEDIQLRNLKPVTYPYQFNDSWIDTVQHGAKVARFDIPIPDIVTGIIRVLIRVQTFPLDAGTSLSNYVATSLGREVSVPAFYVQESDYYPHEMTIKINGVDRTTALGGPFGSYTSALDTTLDITEYITGAVGGIYQNHTIEFTAADIGTDVSIQVDEGVLIGGPGYTSILLPTLSWFSDSASRGRVQLSAQVLGICQAIK